jgi:hypothetical protein
VGGLNSDDKILNRQNIGSTFLWSILLELIYLNYYYNRLSPFWTTIDIVTKW